MARRQVALAFPVAAAHHPEIIQGIVEFAKEHGSWTFLTAPETYDLSVLSLKGWPGDGVIADIFTREEARAACQLGMPVVNLSGALATTSLPRVMNDQRAIGRLAAEHLLRCEIQRFAYYGVDGVWYSRQRGQGFRERLAEAGHTCESLDGAKAFSGKRDWHHWHDNIRQWLKTLKPPLGLMAAHDNRARMLVDACRQLGLVVPHDVAVIGVNNDRFVCEMSQPALSSVAPNAWEIGRRAAQLLERMMSGKRSPAGDVLVPPIGVVARESTDIVAVDDPDLNPAVRFIRQHIGEPFTVADMLRELAVSRRWIEYRFQERFGRSPHEYVCEARVERARQMLMEADGPPLETIAAACGFNSARSFRLVFHRLTGTTPSQYRRARRASRHG
jgi:LacI family transcriptional regulator